MKAAEYKFEKKKTCKYMAGNFLFIADLDYVISEIKSIVPRKITLGYCTQNNKEIHQIGKENFDENRHFRLCLKSGCCYFPEPTTHAVLHRVVVFK
jgi:hypothetical protein